MPAPTTDVYCNVQSDAGIYSFSQALPIDMSGLSPRDATSLIESALAASMEFFLKEYMPFRFHAGYARGELGYHILPSTWKKKIRQARVANPQATMPNVFTGATKLAVLGSTYVETTALGGRNSQTVRATLRIPAPSYLNAQRTQVTNKCLRAITAREAKSIATHFFKNVVDIMSRATTTVVTTKSGTIVPRTSVAKVDAAGFGRTSRSTILASRKGVASGVA